VAELARLVEAVAFDLPTSRRDGRERVRAKLKSAEKSLGTAFRAAHWMAGGRAVAVPRELENAHAYNPVAAETNGTQLTN